MLDRDVLSLTHDLHNRLNTLSIGIELLNGSSVSEQERRQCISAMRQALNESATLVSGILEFTRDGRRP